MLIDILFNTGIWCTCSVLNNVFFYGLAYNTANIAGNIFINFFILGVTEIPSNMAGWWASLNLGRRVSQMMAFVLAGVFATLAVFTG